MQNGGQCVNGFPKIFSGSTRLLAAGENVLWARTRSTRSATAGEAVTPAPPLIPTTRFPRG